MAEEREEQVVATRFALRKGMVWLLDHYGVQAAPPREGKTLIFHPPSGEYTTVKVVLAEGVSETGAKLWAVDFYRYKEG